MSMATDTAFALGALALVGRKSAPEFTVFQQLDGLSP